MQVNNKSISATTAVFSLQQCDALFAAVLVHDDIDLDAKLPDKIHLDYSQEQFEQCYRLCQQIWQQGVTREILLATVKKIYSQGYLDQKDQLKFKYIRAKMKHFRFACVTFGKEHRYPKRYSQTTRYLGRLQDALKNKQHENILFTVFRLRILLNKVIYSLIVKREIENFQITTPALFYQHVINEIDFLRKNLAKDKVTGKEFHEMRKVISQQVALYDNLKILYPSDYHDAMSRFLSTINGLMGSRHDTLIAGKFEGEDNYYIHTFEIPEEIKQRLVELINKYDEP